MSSKHLAAPTPARQYRQTRPKHTESRVSHDTHRDTRASEPFVEWLQCPSWPAYEVSNDGQVRHAATGRVKVQRIDRTGYPAVTLTVNRKPRPVRVHRMVMDAFVGPPPDGMHVNHMDGDKTNSHATNLEYVTPRDNTLHAEVLGLTDHARGGRHYKAKMTEDDVRAIKRRIAGGESTKAIADTYGVTLACISHIKAGRTWAHVA